MGKKMKIFVSPEVEVILTDDQYSRVSQNYWIYRYHEGDDERGDGFVIEEDGSLNAGGVEIIIEPTKIENFASKVVDTLKNKIGLPEGGFYFDDSTGCHLNISFWTEGKQVHYIGRDWYIIAGRNITPLMPLSLMWEINREAEKWLRDNGFDEIADSFYRRYAAKRRVLSYARKESVLKNIPLYPSSFDQKYYTWRVRLSRKPCWEWRSFNLRGLETYDEIHKVLEGISKIIRKVVDKRRYEWKLYEDVVETSKKEKYTEAVQVYGRVLRKETIFRESKVSGIYVYDSRCQKMICERDITVP